jgi:hypothetical protein
MVHPESLVGTCVAHKPQGFIEQPALLKIPVTKFHQGPIRSTVLQVALFDSLGGTSERAVAA